MDEGTDVQCVECGEDYPLQRRLLGFKTCLLCGETAARAVEHCVVPMHKSSLIVVGPGDRDILKGIGNKGGQVNGSGSSSGEGDD